MAKSNITEQEKNVWLAMADAQSLVDMFGFIDDRGSDSYASLARGAMDRLTTAVDIYLSCKTVRQGKRRVSTKGNSAA